jgi:hypothetical protein
MTLLLNFNGLKEVGGFGLATSALRLPTALLRRKGHGNLVDPIVETRYLLFVAVSNSSSDS